MKKDITYRLLIILAILIISAFYQFPWSEKINLGLDLQGGVHLVLQVDMDEVLRNELQRISSDIIETCADEGIFIKDTKITNDSVEVWISDARDFDKVDDVIYRAYNYLGLHKDRDQGYFKITLREGDLRKMREETVTQALETIRNRVDAFGVSEPVIQRQGLAGDRILIQLPGYQDVNRAKEIIGTQAFLEFQIVKDGPYPTREDLLSKYNNRLPPNTEILKGGRKDKNNNIIPEWYLLDRNAPVTGRDLENAMVGQDEYGLPAVNFQLSRQGGTRMSRLTKDHIRDQMAIVLDNKVMSAPVIQSKLYRDIQITGNFTIQEAKDLALILRAGALPAPIDYLEERTVGPSLGADSIRQGVRSFILGGVAVIILMLVTYRLGGLIANISLICNIFIILGILSMFKAVLTLPGIAGIILTVGMAVDANVLIFERIREEYAKKRADKLTGASTLRSAIELGFRRAFLTILDANVTTLIAAFVLLHFGAGPVRGFAVTLSIGIFASVFAAMVISWVIFDLLAYKGGLQKLNFMRFFTNPNIPFLKYGKISVTASSIFIIIGLIAYFIIGSFNFGIDFSGGVLLLLKFKQDTSVQQVRDALGEIGLQQSVIQKDQETSEIMIRAQMLHEDEDIARKILTKLHDTFGKENIELRQEEMVGPQVGSELKKSAIIAIVFAMICMIIYIAIRFEFIWGLGAVVAIIHDVAVALTFLLLFKMEISLPVVAAMLTIVGYSLNDTIVIFDRVRENLRNVRRTKNVSFAGLLNDSINQVLSRTVMTSLTTFVVVLCLFLFGGPVIKVFSFAMLIGVVAGTYSTCFIAAPFVLWIKGDKLPEKKSSIGRTAKRRRR